MSSLIYILLITFPIIICLFLTKHKKPPHDRLPPGPKGLPLIGNLFQIDASAPHRCLWQLSQIYGPLMTLKQGCIRILVVSSAKMAREVMTTHDINFSNRQPVVGQQKLSYNGLDLAFAPYGSYWREMRKICVVHLFNSNRVQSFGPIREFEVSQMLEKISKSSFGSNKPFNLSDAMTSLTSTIICRVAFGKRYEEEGIERSRFQSLLKETQVMFTSFSFSDHFPFLSFMDGLSGLLSRLDKNFKEFDAFYQEVIDEHLDPNRAKPKQEDILDVLLQIWKDRSFKVQLTFDNIKAILMNVFIGGTDTSAAAVVWAMTYLMKNPIKMRKAQEEKGFVNEQDIQQLSYLKAVVKETMRLQPAVPFLVPRESIENCNLGGYVIPAKTVIYLNAWAIGRDPEAWGENPEEFKPERFIGNSIDVKGVDFELIPFGGGRRICPGIHMGLSTVELSLANLLYAFDWEMPTGVKSEDLDMEISPGLAMHKKNALCLIANKYI
ncbi:Cytochrome P450 83B1 [Linum grandiflorum]